MILSPWILCKQNMMSRSLLAGRAVVSESILLPTTKPFVLHGNVNMVSRYRNSEVVVIRCHVNRSLLYSNHDAYLDEYIYSDSSAVEYGRFIYCKQIWHSLLYTIHSKVLKFYNGTYQLPIWSTTSKLSVHIFIWVGKHIVPDQTAPLGAVWSGTILYAHGCFSTWISFRYPKRWAIIL